MSKKIRNALAGIQVLDTSIAKIEDHEMYIRGYTLTELVENSTFEEVFYLLLNQELPNPIQYSDFTKYLWGLREQIPLIIQKQMDLFSGREVSLNVLVSCLSALQSEILSNIPPSVEQIKRQAIHTIAMTPTLLAWHYRKSIGQPKIQTDPKLDHSTNFYYMITGEPDKQKGKIVNWLMVLFSENELPAATFASRISASSRTRYYDSLITGLCTISGYRHGAAMNNVHYDLVEIANGKSIEDYYQNSINTGRPHFGFGHRVHKTKVDKRVLVVKEIARNAQKIYGGRLFHVSEEVDKFMTNRSKRPLFPNVDFYIPALLESLGLDKMPISNIPLAARIAGMSAHIIEEIKGGNLRPIFHPASLYTGVPKRNYVPIKNR